MRSADAISLYEMGFAVVVGLQRKFQLIVILCGIE
jgi:hypothetical protein